ncbi:hypothetical protein QC763_103455 [Podospora pseudopauciseta]|uniref:Uncharacterized protein n=1 Tax=Podospora pseudopauciseta TaxID=2093780 RepID=A0ABR0HX11_9PEZI|nr:hypothetical protein QC763_103455 [Podospora pseudopauciseta]
MLLLHPKRASWSKRSGASSNSSNVRSWHRRKVPQKGLGLCRCGPRIRAFGKTRRVADLFALTTTSGAPSPDGTAPHTTQRAEQEQIFFSR